MKKASDFVRYLKDKFSIELPEEIEITHDPKYGIRAHNKAVHGSRAWGVRGFNVFADGKTKNYFIQLVGHLARKNTAALNLEDAKKFVSGREIIKKIKMEKGEVILVYKGHVLGVGTHLGKGKILSTVKKPVEIVNDVKNYQGRNL
ncbi:hypothetical protein HYT84_00230 [Candidatus Micrarchaeota archaeon]|nr:hypothetical protein [Candidatus Micrarchaeota archaeon]